MTVSSLNSLSQNATGATQKSAASVAQTYDQFLKLLTTQLKNQDPLSPMDSNQMTAQLVQFSQVEQQLAINDKLDKMVAQSKIDATLNAAGFIDKTVEATGDYAILDSANSAISGKFVVTLEADAPKTMVTIKNSEGQAVRTLTFSGDKSLHKGRNEIQWDGKNAAGADLPDGAYTLSLKALDPDAKGDGDAKDGKEIKGNIATIGRVTDIMVDGKGVAKLSLSGAQIALDAIKQIKKTA